MNQGNAYFSNYNQEMDKEKSIRSAKLTLLKNEASNRKIDITSCLVPDEKVLKILDNKYYGVFYNCIHGFINKTGDTLEDVMQGVRSIF